MFERYEGWNDLVAGLYLYLEEIKEEKKRIIQTISKTKI